LDLGIPFAESLNREEVAMNLPTAATLRRNRVLTVVRKKYPLLRRPAVAPDGGEAFVRDFRSGFAPIRDGDTEAAGEVFVWAATSNDAASELARDEVHAEELGGLVIDLDDEDAFALMDVD
jgi:hypothetical protein